jgi:CRP-like cAMP-binding protein
VRFSSFFQYPDLEDQNGPDDLTLLGDCSEEEWAKLIDHTQRRQFEADETIVTQGDADRSLYIVARGTLEVRVPKAKGYGSRVHTIEKGCVFGEQAFLDGGPRSANVVSVSDGELLVLSLDAFNTLVGWEPKLAAQILLDLGRILSLRLRHTTSLLSKWIS